MDIDTVTAAELAAFEATQAEEADVEEAETEGPDLDDLIAWEREAREMREEEEARRDRAGW
jgi:hypothetical protein